jgi:hypothetical protein
MPDNVAEARFQAQVVRLARELGLVVHHHYDARKSSPGWPDLAIVDPRPVGWTGPIGETQGMPYVYLVELKTARGKLTREQELWLRALHGKTVVAECWRPGQLQEILAKLRGA